jgi:hypothetical protein
MVPQCNREGLTMSGKIKSVHPELVEGFLSFPSSSMGEAMLINKKGQGVNSYAPYDDLFNYPSPPPSPSPSRGEGSKNV